MTRCPHSGAPARTKAALIGWALLAIGCSSVTDRAGDSAGSGSAEYTEPQDWEEVMHRLGDDLGAIEKEFDRPAVDLNVISTAARRAAALVGLGYGKFEDDRVDGFARMSRDCESWLLQVANEASLGHQAICTELMKQREVHCVRCHDEAGMGPW